MTELLVTVGWLCGWWLLAVVRRLPHRVDALRRPVSIVVPARNEERSLPALLASIPDGHDVVVVDDGSTDATAAVATTAGARVVPAGAPPEGWYGKPWACTVGALAATTDTLVFLDADCRLDDGGLDRLVAVLDGGGGLVSAQPWHEMRRPSERLVAVCNVVAMMGTGAWTPLGRRRRVAAAFGPCLVTTAGDYRSTGGHGAEGVRDAVAEDVALARRYAAAGLPVRLYGGRGAVRFRMYPDGLAAIVRGYAKNLLAGAQATRPLTFLGVSLWVTGAVLAAVGAGGSVAYVAYAGQLSWMLVRLGTFGLWPALLFPLPLAVFLVAFARSAWGRLSGRGVDWRGRTVR